MMVAAECGLVAADTDPGRSPASNRAIAPTAKRRWSRVWFMVACLMLPLASASGQLTS